MVNPMRRLDDAAMHQRLADGRAMGLASLLAAALAALVAMQLQHPFLV